ncbi:MAG: hypothetical protein JO250_20305, partial [Armatimonadetes bacterium]|nr:hypothetical protein [Armatimonadota bacterium]
MKTLLASLLLASAFALAVPSQAGRPPGAPTLRAGAARLSLLLDAAREAGVQMQAGGVAYTQAAPLAVEVVDAQGTARWLTGGYEGVTSSQGTLTGTGALASPGGTQFRITDKYQSLPKLGAFTLTRQVDIVGLGSDKGFSSRFSLAPARMTAMADCDFFAPGIWYKDNARVPPRALASHRDDRSILFREDRLPLPVMMLRDRRNGATFTLAHLGGDPATFAGEDGLDRIIDARMQFGAVGITNTDGPAPTFLFPGTEGERTYIYGGSLQENRWAYRSHPVQAGFSQRYRLLLQVGRTADFPAAVRGAWRTVYDLQHPPVIPCDLAKVYRDSMALLAADIHEYHGVISVPFAAVVPGGEVTDTSSQMGFVGQALPAAALLLKNCLETEDAGAAARAAEVVDFWARNCMTPAGVPRTWYDIHADGRYTWRSYHTFLRVASDGLDGALQAWNVMRRHGQDRPEWLAF